jgi:hypothetical protein
MRASWPALRVVAGLDFSATPTDDAKALAEARKRARPILREWLHRIELAVMGGELSPTDYLMAKELGNYPSANQGRCYAGQERLGREGLGSSARTARASLKRLRDRGFLSRKRGGPGRTASWTFCVNDKPIFEGAAFLPASPSPIENTQHCAPDRKEASGLDRKDVSAKPLEQGQPTERNPPFSPGTASESGGPTKPTTIDGEIIAGVISFQEFWLAAGRPGHEGFARAEWRKLSASDRAAITDRLRRDGELGLRNLWAGTWLRDRVWEEPPLPAIEFKLFERPVIVHAQPGSELWRAERERLLVLGDLRSVKLMDDFAAAGKGWTVECRRNAKGECD